MAVSFCGYVVEKLPLNIRKWGCPECGSHHDRDINASRNILFWLRDLPCQSGLRSFEPKRVNLAYAGAIKQKAPNSDARESRRLVRAASGGCQ